MTEKIEFKDKLVAIIIRTSFNKKGIHFFTPENSSQQLGYMNRPVGYIIPPHSHKPLERTTMDSQEVLFIKSGKVKIDFFADNEEFIESRVLEEGDVILIASCGHGFEILEDAEMIEVKQGPYLGDEEKILINPAIKSKK